MSGVMRFQAWDPRDVRDLTMVVLASDFDALAQQLAASEARCEEILEDFEILKGERESAGRQASAFEERMGEFQARCGKLESALEATKTVHKAAQNRAADASTQLAARDKRLEEAVGLLRRCRFDSLNMPLADMKAVSAFLATIEQDEAND